MGRFKTSTVFTHAAAWLLFISFPTLFLLQGSRQHFSLSTIDPWSYLQFIVVFASIFYLNAYYLFPRLYFNKKKLIYGISCLMLLTLVLMIRPFDNMISQFRAHGKPKAEKSFYSRPSKIHFDLMSMFIFITLMGMGTTSRSIKEWELTEKRALLAEAEHANVTLSFLKAQINPHFLYNTLNNIYTLCLNDSPNAADSIMKLSNIMRYVTEDTQPNYVPLQGEIDCMNNFIELQKLRLGKKTMLDYSISGDPTGHEISPLILMTFVENIFKHGLSNHNLSNIHISLTIKPGKLVFHAKNHIFLKPDEHDRTGLGISNTRQRLALLYPGKHELNIRKQNNLFIVNLILFS